MKYKCAFKDETGKTIPNRKNRKSEKRVAFAHNKSAHGKVQKFKKYIRGMMNGVYELKTLANCECPTHTEEVEKLAGSKHPYSHTVWHRTHPVTVSNDTNPVEVQS